MRESRHITELPGVYISNDLKWTHHVEIVKDGNKRLYSLRVLKVIPLK